MAMVGACAALAIGCEAGTVEVTRVYSPRDAAALQKGELTPVAVVRGDQRMPIPANARLEPERVVLSGEHVHKLGPHDVIETDDTGRITGVRTEGNPPVEIHFIPGTAVSPADSDVVRGQLAADASSSIVLRPGDRIEMRGNFAPDDAVPGGARVESTRSSGVLVAGIIIFGLGYLPSAYMGIGGKHGLGKSDGYDGILLLPVAGPWIDLAARPGCTPPPGSDQLPVDPCVGESIGKAALVIGGTLQTVGFVFGAIGLSSRTEVVEPERDRGVRGASSKATWTVVPTANARGSGAAIVGTF
jgi:hypothetical protein